MNTKKLFIFEFAPLDEQQPVRRIELSVKETQYYYFDQQGQFEKTLLKNIGKCKIHKSFVNHSIKKIIFNINHEVIDDENRVINTVPIEYPVYRYISDTDDLEAFYQLVSKKIKNELMVLQAEQEYIKQYQQLLLEYSSD